MSEARIRIGIGGWTYPEWRRLFYPPGLAQSKEQAFAASTFGAIEINSTFYSRQSPASWAKWGAAAPQGFEYAIKGSRYVVSRPKLADAGEGLGNFFAQGMDALGDKLGPFLWMLSRHRQFDADDIAAFLDLLPRTLSGRPLRHVLEPRHESFRDPRFVELCTAHQVAVVYGDDDEFPLLDLDTGPFRYARLQRMREDIETGYDGVALGRFAQLASGWQAKGRDGYVFMINGAKLRAPAAALALQQRLGITPG
jgi:uncharacterized protein YecE (DUF72 family)